MTLTFGLFRSGTVSFLSYDSQFSFCPLLLALYVQSYQTLSTSIYSVVDFIQVTRLYILQFLQSLGIVTLTTSFFSQLLKSSHLTQYLTRFTSGFVQVTSPHVCYFSLFVMSYISLGDVDIVLSGSCGSLPTQTYFSHGFFYVCFGMLPILHSGIQIIIGMFQ